MGFVLLVLMPQHREPPDCCRDEVINRGGDSWISLELLFPSFFQGPSLVGFSPSSSSLGPVGILSIPDRCTNQQVRLCPTCPSYHIRRKMIFSKIGIGYYTGRIFLEGMLYLRKEVLILFGLVYTLAWD